MDLCSFGVDSNDYFTIDFSLVTSEIVVSDEGIVAASGMSAISFEEDDIDDS